MDLSRLRLNRIVAHLIPEKPSPDAVAQARYGRSLIDLGSGEQDILTRRVTEVLGKPSNSVEMAIVEDGVDSTFQHCAALIRANDDEFLTLSQRVADNLCASQTRTDIPDSVLLVATGKAGMKQQPIITVVKAETQDGFSLIEDDGTLRVELIRELFLTPDQKLYKVGLFIEVSEASLGNETRNPDDFGSLVYDSNLRSTSRPAQYFYSSFLGCTYAESGKALTQRFYNETQAFIARLDVDDESKRDLNTHLYSYLKSEQELINVTEFASNFIPQEHRTDYQRHMVRNDVPERSIEKDLALVSSQLVNRHIKFKNGIKITGKSDGFDQNVAIESQSEEGTTVRIKSTISSID